MFLRMRYGTAEAKMHAMFKANEDEIGRAILASEAGKKAGIDGTSQARFDEALEQTKERGMELMTRMERIYSRRNSGEDLRTLLPDAKQLADELLSEGRETSRRSNDFLRNGGMGAMEIDRALYPR